MAFPYLESSHPHRPQVPWDKLQEPFLFYHFLLFPNFSPTWNDFIYCLLLQVNLEAGFQGLSESGPILPSSSSTSLLQLYLPLTLLSIVKYYPSFKTPLKSLEEISP